MKHGEGRRWLLRRRTAMEADLNPSPLGPSDKPRVTGGSSSGVRKVTVADLKARIRSSAFAFRGYDIANLGRSRELLEHEVYGPVVARVLEHASALCSEAIQEKVDLADYIRSGKRTALETFPLDIATIVAIEAAQLRLLEECFAIPIRDVRFSFGYSIGELTALIFSGVFSLEQLLPIPLELAGDCAALAHGTTLGVLFTRGPELPPEDVERFCLAISGEGKGLIGPSAFLSPNTALLLGQGKTLDRVEQLMRDFLPANAMLRRNSSKWPPLHSPLVWQKLVPNRTAVALYRIEGSPAKPSPPIISSVTGEASYDEFNSREILVRWTDHPQRLWDVIDTTLAEGVETIVHVGPSPSLIAATFARISNNVSRHPVNGNKYLHKLGRGLVSGLNRHVWLSRHLPSQTALLKAPYLTHINLEDWLLEQQGPRSTTVDFTSAGDGHPEDFARVPAPDVV